MNTIANDNPFGSLLREWRRRRRLSQLDLALDAGISQRHVSFVESGRAQPSREMVVRLAEQMDVPLRERNRMLLAAGFAPGYEERSIGHPTLKPAMSAVQAVLKGHEPFPAIAVDRHWNMVASNDAIGPFLKTVTDPALLAAPVNVLKLSLHPNGLAPMIDNLAEWRVHLLGRLRMQIDNSGDTVLAALERELSAYPSSGQRPAQGFDPANAVAVPLRLRDGGRILSFISTITVFGTPLDVTLSELAIESFFPADAETGAYLREIYTGR